MAAEEQDSGIPGLARVTQVPLFPQEHEDSAPAGWPQQPNHLVSIGEIVTSRRREASPALRAPSFVESAARRP
ncbi:predicted protein [Coccidioides posadasii str. Silveira]|uniref:Predicted protein n=1 Tax=Coccidioides posadasii (strain RMSCC 757 / Silveira) TaxID=443226 RepID=E9D0A7_COCPS|nr:predicted protein [Coccidioides posadasii str. Silveira]